MARQARAPRTPHPTGPSQPHGPQRPRGQTAPQEGWGTRAIGAARSGGNLAKEVLFNLADFIAKLLRRIFGKVMSQDLEQRRAEKREAVNRESENLESLKNEKADLERELKRDRDSQGERGREKKRDPHADLLERAELLREASKAERPKPDHSFSVTPAGPFWETKTIPSGAGAGAAGVAQGGSSMVAGSSEEAVKVDDWHKALADVASGNRSIGDLARFELLAKLHGGHPYSQPSMAAAVDRIREVGGGSSMGQGGVGMFDMLTCAGYLEAGMANARLKMLGEHSPEIVEADVETHVWKIMEEVMAHGSSPEEWTSALAAKAASSAQKVEKLMHPGTGRVLDHDPQDDPSADVGPDTGRWPRLPGPSGP